MSKELRANLIFLGILLVVIAPGFYILMKKKLTGSSAPNYMPDPVPHAVAYIHPPPVNPSLPRKEPPEVRAWVNKIIQDKFDPKATVLLRPNLISTVQSDLYRSQAILLDQTEADGLTRCVILIWDEKATNASVQFVTASGEIIAANADSYPLDIPPNILHRLQDVGYPYPLSKLLVVVATNPQIKPADLSQVILNSSQGDKTTQETINFKP